MMGKSDESLWDKYVEEYAKEHEQMEAEQNIWAACNKMIKERKESDA